MADPEFHNGGRTVEGEGSGEEKFEFLPENGVFWCILGLLFKIGQANGGAAAPRPLTPWIRHCASVPVTVILVPKIAIRIHLVATI